MGVQDVATKWEEEQKVQGIHHMCRQIAEGQEGHNEDLAAKE